MKVTVIQLHKREKPPDWRRIASEIERGMDDYVKPRLVSYGERVTRSWEHSVEWGTRKTIHNGALSLYMWPKTNADVWSYVSRGTRPHIIRPRKARVLVFPTGYVPHTEPRGPSYSGPGKATGPTVLATVVHHPGSKGRHFEEAFGRWIRPYFERQVREAIERGAKAK